MRLTLETTKSEPKYSYKSTNEKPYDDIPLDEMFDWFADVLEGIGYVGARKYLEGEDA